MTDTREFIHSIMLLKSIRAHSNKDYPVETEDLEHRFLEGVHLRTPKEAFEYENLFMPDDWRSQGAMLKERDWVNIDDLDSYLARQNATNAILVWKKPTKISPNISSIRKRFKKVWKILLSKGNIPADPEIIPTKKEISSLPYLVALRLKSLWVRKNELNSWYNTSFLSLTSKAKDSSLKSFAVVNR
jgi:hypothetical protein